MNQMRAWVPYMFACHARARPWGASSQKPQEEIFLAHIRVRVANY